MGGDVLQSKVGGLLDGPGLKVVAGAEDWSGFPSREDAVGAEEV